MYGSFYEGIGKGLFFNRLFWVCMYALNMVGFNLDLLGLHVMAHLVD